MKNKQSKGLSLSANPKCLIKGIFFAATDVFASFFRKNDILKNNKHSTKLAGGVQYGRSMIEMLGVLAIIGVLSVGGIAGYSKAMRMWRSNIQRNMIAEFIAGAIKVKSNLAGQKNKYSQFENITPALAKMGDIPEGVTYSNGSLITKDNMSVIIRYGFQTWTNGGELRYSILFNYQKGNDFSPTISDFCRNLIITAQQAAEEINLIAYWGTDSNRTDNNKTSGVQLYNSQNLKQATLSEINNKCQDPFKEAGGATFELLLWPY